MYRLLKEARKLEARLRALLRIVELRARSSHDQNDTGDSGLTDHVWTLEELLRAA